MKGIFWLRPLTTTDLPLPCAVVGRRPWRRRRTSPSREARRESSTRPPRPRGIEKSGLEPQYQTTGGCNNRRWMLTAPESRIWEPFPPFNAPDAQPAGSVRSMVLVDCCVAMGRLYWPVIGRFGPDIKPRTDVPVPPISQPTETLQSLRSLLRPIRGSRSFICASLAIFDRFDGSISPGQGASNPLLPPFAIFSYSK